VSRVVEYTTVGFNIPLDTIHVYRSFRGQFYRSHEETNSVIALKDNGKLNGSRTNPTKLAH